MNTYEFWNDMDKIFDAIVAYQEKTIEFNKQFVNPWIKLGKVFDKKETNETVIAHKNAVEIDPANPQNWYELAGACARAGNFDQAIHAYQRSAELGLETGELYKNLALSHVMTGKYQEAVSLFEKSLDLLDKNEEKVTVWNQLGNVYRKLDNYELALHAFQQADQFEHEPHAEVENAVEELTEEPVTFENEVDTSQPTDEPAPVIENETVLEDETFTEDEVDLPLVTESSEVELNEEQEEQFAEEENEEVESVDVAEEADDEEDDEENDMPVILEIDYSLDSAEMEAEEETLSEKQPASEFLAALEREAAGISTKVEMISEETETETQEMPEDIDETPAVAQQAPEPIDRFAGLTDSDEEDTPAAEVAEEELPTSTALTQESEDPIENLVEDAVEEVFAESEATEGENMDVEEESEETDSVEEDEENEAFEVEWDEVPSNEEQTVAEELEESVEVDEPEGETELSQEVSTTPTFSAYEEYLQDNEHVEKSELVENETNETETIAMVPAEVEVTRSEVNMDVNTDLTVDMDTKNAHVWNELGNVYFNAGSFDDAIAAYSKAIELDRQFAWPYTNLALSYVQKDRLEDAIQLYQRSIELFSNEEDKAVTLNRLGNVYRRLNDYENAIAAYQRADELDPGNMAIAKQSRFSLLGSEQVNQEVSHSV